MPATLRIEICNDSVWAGAGRVVNGYIADVPVQWCDDADESENVYEEIEDAIANGDDSVRVSTSDGTLNLSWILTPLAS